MNLYKNKVMKWKLYEISSIKGYKMQVAVFGPTLSVKHIRACPKSFVLCPWANNAGGVNDVRSAINAHS